MGVDASADSFLISKGGCEESEDTAGVVDAMVEAASSVFRRLASGELGSDGGRWSAFVVAVAGGVKALVMLYTVC